MAYIHSTYSGTTFAPPVTGVIVAGILVTSVVDGMLVFVANDPLQNPTDVIFDYSGTPQPLTMIRGTLGSQVVSTSAWYVDKPNQGVLSLITSWANPTYGGVFIVLLTGTHPTTYLRGTAVQFGSATSCTTNPGPLTGDLEIDVLCYNRRDTVGAPAYVGADQSIIYNVAINSGGGTLSLGMCASVSTHATVPSMNWGFSTSAGFHSTSVAIKDSTFNAPGTLVIRHAPGA